jgi:hypothetical protein
VTATTTDGDLRQQVLRDFSLAGGLPQLQRVVQHGEDPATVRYTFHFDQGREVRVPSAAVLFSQAQLNQLFAVVLRRTMITCKPGEWRERISVLVEHAVEVEERPGERFVDTVAEWVHTYADRATSDRDGAAALRAPFHEDDVLYLAATELAKYVRREYSEQVKLAELREALADLGFDRVTVNYSPKKGPRSTVSYYRCKLSEITPS